MSKQITQAGEKVSVQFGRYPADNSQVFMQTFDEDGIPFSRLTTCIPGVGNEDGQAIIDVNNNGREILSELVDQGIIELTGRSVTSGYNEYPVVNVLVKGE